MKFQPKKVIRQTLDHLGLLENEIRQPLNRSPPESERLPSFGENMVTDDRENWIDFTRVIASFMVIVLHSSGKRLVNHIFSNSTEYVMVG